MSISEVLTEIIVPMVIPGGVITASLKLSGLQYHINHEYSKRLTRKKDLVMLRHQDVLLIAFGLFKHRDPGSLLGQKKRHFLSAFLAFPYFSGFEAELCKFGGYPMMGQGLIFMYVFHIFSPCLK
jgi:hypothetical protein